MTNSPTTTYRPVRANTAASFMSKVYLWMMVALGLSALCSYAIMSHPYLLMTVIQSPAIFWGAFIVQIGSVFVISRMAYKGNFALSASLFVFYSLLSGVTLTIICAAFTATMITYAFVATAAGFVGLSLVGFITKKDLGPIASFCFMGLFGLIGISVIAMFVPSMMSVKFQMIYSCVGVLVFAGLTAYDTQRIKTMSAVAEAQGGNATQAFAIGGALSLYLDFINLFINLLMLLNGGSRR